MNVVRDLKRALAEPDKWCISGRCRETNWGGNDRLHVRQSDCPVFREAEIQAYLQRAESQENESRARVTIARLIAKLADLPDGTLVVLMPSRRHWLKVSDGWWEIATGVSASVSSAEVADRPGVFEIAAFPPELLMSDEAQMAGSKALASYVWDAEGARDRYSSSVDAVVKGTVAYVTETMYGQEEK